MIHTIFYPDAAAPEKVRGLRAKGDWPMEYEVVSHRHLPGIRVFVVEIFNRTAHTHREYELCLLLRGGMQIDSYGSSVRLRTGELALFSPRQPHAFRAMDEGALLLILQASPQFCASYFPQAAQVQFEETTRLSCEAPLRSAMLALGEVCFAQRPGYEFAAMAEVNRVFDLLFGHVGWRIQPQQVDRGASRVTRLAARIEASYAEPLRLRELAEAEGVSPDYLSHAFRQYIGMTFQDYLSRVRLEHAAALLERTACGYSSPRYLTADFRRRMGCTPAAYRKGAVPRETESLPISSDTQERFFTNEQSLQILEQYRRKADGEVVQNVEN